MDCPQFLKNPQVGLAAAVDNLPGGSVLGNTRRTDIQPGGLQIDLRDNAIHSSQVRIGNDNINISVGTAHGSVIVAPHSHTQTLAESLSQLDFSLLQAEAFARRTDGTFEWLLETPEYTTWKAQEKGGLLLCLGKPGAGKTTFASFVIHNLQQQKDSDSRLVASVCYIYCRYNTSFTPLQLFELLLKQLILQCPTTEIDRLQELKDQGRRPTLDEIIAIIQRTATHTQNIFIIVDAADECFTEETRHRLLRMLRSLVSVKVLITSRILPSIEHALEGIPVLTIEPHAEDIRKHFQARSLDSPNLAYLLPKVCSADVENKLIAQADGMFLLAELHITHLSEQTNPRDFLAALAMLPNGASDVYTRAWDRIQQQPLNMMRIALQVLSWLFHAFRTLKVAELQYGIALVRSDESPQECDLDEETLIISSCAGLLNVNEETKDVTFIHYTVQEFLVDYEHELVPGIKIATSCLRIISAQGIQLVPPNHPLINYSASYWGDIVRKFIGDKAIFELALQHLAAPSQLYILLHAYHGRGGNALHLASTYGVKDIIAVLLQDDGHSVNQQDEDGFTPLHLSANNGHTEVVRMLLEKDANPNIRNNDGDTSLSLAAQYGYSEAVQVLLRREADPSIPDTHDNTPFHWAAFKGHLEVLQELVCNDKVNIDSQNREGITPCLVAAANGHLAVVDFLASKGANLSTQESTGCTPLFSAAAGGWSEVVKFLAEKSSKDIEVKDTRGRTPLSIAAANGHLTVVQFLASQAIDLIAQDNDGSTPLWWSVHGGNLDVVKFLAERTEITLEQRDKRGNTPLSEAAACGRVDIIQFLASKANIRVEDNNKRTPLWWAARYGHLEAVMFLAERADQDIDKKNVKGRTPLFIAAANGHLAVVRFLVSQPVDVSAQDHEGRSPLHAAAAAGSLDLVQFLVDRTEHDVDIRDKYGITPMSRAAFYGQLNIVKFLATKVDVSSADNWGCTPLWWAAKCAHLEVVKFLAEKADQDTDQSNQGGNTPLLIAASEGHLDVVVFLADRGADLSAPDEEGSTALSWAAWKGHLEVVKFLVHRMQQDMHRANQLGFLPLRMAARGGHADVVRYLLVQDDVDPNARTSKDQLTSLLVAVGGGHLEVVKVLLDVQGVDIHAQDSYGLTAVILAANEGHLPVLDCLLSHPRVLNHPALHRIRPFYCSLVSADPLSIPLLELHPPSSVDDTKQSELPELPPMRSFTPTPQPPPPLTDPEKSKFRSYHCPRPTISLLFVIASILVLLLAMLSRD